MTAIGDVNKQFYSGPSIVDGHSSYALFREEKELFKRYLRPAERIADLACGAGRTTLRLYEMGVRPTGLDLSGPLISAAARRFPYLPFVRGSYTALPFKNDYFDCALISFNGIDYAPRVEDRAAAFEECHRILKAAGKLILSSHNIKSLHFSPYYFLEFGTLRFKLIHTFSAFKSAAYLNSAGRTVRTFHAAPEYVVNEAENAGFRFVEWLGFRNLRDRVKNRYISPWIHYVFTK